MFSASAPLASLLGNTNRAQKQGARQDREFAWVGRLAALRRKLAVVLGARRVQEWMVVIWSGEDGDESAYEMD